MVMLRTGLYYDSSNNKYIDGSKNNELDPIVAKKFFNDDEIPFLHSKFKDHKAMNIESFNHEVKQLSHLSNNDLAPRVHGHCVVNKNGIHYGFIVMEKIDCSVKQIILNRDLTNDEDNIIKNLIHELHNNHSIVKMVILKPSNIGVYLSKCGHIRKCVFLDCQKVKRGEKYDEHIT